jgi:prevent-host-death family protein
MEASVLDLRMRSTDVMRAVTRGERVLLTYRGRDVAYIVPLRHAGKGGKNVADTQAFGMWATRLDLVDPAGYVERLRKPRDF